MNRVRDTILVVDDQKINRKMVCKQLSDTYSTMEASNGKEALQMVQTNKRIGVILLDLIMPEMDGFQFMEALQDLGMDFIPVIVMTADDDVKVEERALELGAVDFVKKPSNRRILRSRIENALVRNQMVMLERMRFMATHDSLTKMYNRTKMFDSTRKLIDKHRDVNFAFIRFDIDKFRLYNSAMGEEAGDKLLLKIADEVIRIAESYDEDLCTYGRIDADVFCLCEPYDEGTLMEHIKYAEDELAKYRSDYSLDASFGIYVIDEPELSVETIYTRASMAASKCKNLYEVHYAYYDASMTEKIEYEQTITNEMKGALENEEFEVYLQPKYDLNTDMPCGAEALVRWNHPVKGLIPPGKFIPVFEKNGFVATLDYYMWEKVCKMISEWMQAGKKIFPISVNMSRVSLFNRHVDELIMGLVEKYKVPPKYLNLEITESAYMSSPEMMNTTIARLRGEGFIILMDDFGSGYSSLNTLKEIDIDILKLDMKFMPNGNDKGRSERILSSIVRMAGWLNMEVIAEGVETAAQKQFLECIGCGYVQGYYYAKPMPIREYEELIKSKAPLIDEAELTSNRKEVSEAVWSSNPQIGEILSSIEEPVAILEYSSVNTELIRVNQAYKDVYGNDITRELNGHISKESELQVKKSFDITASTGKATACEFQYISDDGIAHWKRIKTRRVETIPKSAILCCLIEEITKEKLYENRLINLINSYEDLTQKRKLLIIDDVEVSRLILRNMFEDRYSILEAANGLEGLELLDEHGSDIAAILLDMVMPEMDGEVFLGEKNKVKKFKNIPVVVISAENDVAVQLGMLKNGVSDYILKPFDIDITQQRVENAMSYQSRFRQLVEEYKAAMIIADESEEEALWEN